MLLICTGNTCRSPLAEALLRRALHAQGASGIEVGSAGTGAWDGAPASEGSYLVALENGLDLGDHSARLLTEQLVAGADLILAMGMQHKRRAIELGGAGKTELLSAFARDSGREDVSDPFGAALDAYRDTFRELARLTDAVAARLAAEA